MLEIKKLLSVADAYKLAANVEDVTLSHRLFADSKKICALRGGADITVRRYNAALQWLSSNWPDNADWPDDVIRPECLGVEAAE